MFLDVFSEYVRLFKVPQDPAVDLHVPHHGQKLDINCPSLDRPDRVKLRTGLKRNSDRRRCHGQFCWIFLDAFNGVKYVSCPIGSELS